MLRSSTIICLASLLVASHISHGLANDQPAAAATKLTRSAASDGQATESSKLDYEPPGWPEPPDTEALLFRLAAGTVTVLVACVVTLVAGRRWLRGPAAKTDAGSKLQIIESVSLGNRCSVYLLRAGQHQIVVGTDRAGMKSLIALPESFERSLAEVETESEGPESVAGPAEPLVAIGA